METLTITMDTRPRHLEEFCGPALLQWTGVSKVITPKGNILIGMNDTIVKNDDGTFEVIKSTE